MANEEQEKAPNAGQQDGAASVGSFNDAFAERSQDPARGREAAGAEADAPAHGPADEAGSQEAPAQAAADDSSGTKAPAFDPYAGMTPEQKAHWEKRDASERSQRGRVAALTKKLNGYVAPTRQAAPQDDSTGQSEQQTGDGSKTADIEARLAQVAEDYRDVNGPVVEVIQAMRAEIAGLTASATRNQVEADAAVMTEAYDGLGAKHPDYEEIASDPAFHTEWLGEQPANIVALANSFDPREVSLALTLYKAESGLTGNAAEGQSGGQGSTAQGDKRARQLEGSRQVATRGTPTAAGVPNDFGSAFRSRVKAQG